MSMSRDEMIRISKDFSADLANLVGMIKEMNGETLSPDMMAKVNALDFSLIPEVSANAYIAVSESADSETQEATFAAFIAEVDKLLAGDAGSAFDNTSDFAEEGKDVKKKRVVNRSKADQIIAEFVSSNTNGNKHKCAQAISEQGAIIAYLNLNPEGIDIARKKITDKFEFIAKFNAPSVQKGYVIAVPAEAYNAVKGGYANEEEIPASAYAEGQAKTVICLDASEFEEFICLHALGCIREDANLFVPNYVKRMTSVKDAEGKSSRSQIVVRVGSINDDKKWDELKDSIPSGPNSLYYGINFKKDKATQVRTPYGAIKHTMKQRLLAPNNYISAKRYETEEIKLAYSEAEAKELTQNYFGRFSKKLGELMTTNITVQNEAIVSSTFFSTDPATSYWQSNPTVDHWFNTGADGQKEQVGLVGKGLIKHVVNIEEVATKSGDTKQVVRHRVVAKEMAAEIGMNEENKFVFDINDESMKHIKAAAEANGVTINGADIVNFFKTKEILKEKKNGKGAKEKTPKSIGRYSWGIYLAKNADMKNQLSAALNTISK